MHKEIGMMIRHFRKKQRLSQLAFAKKAGVGKTVIFDIEHGKPSIQLDTVFKILNALDIKILFKTPTTIVDFK